MDTIIHSTTRNSHSSTIPPHRRHYHIRGLQPGVRYYQDTLWPVYGYAQHDFAGKLAEGWQRLTFDYCDHNCLD